MDFSQACRVVNIVFLMMILAMIVISLLTHAWIFTEDECFGLWEMCSKFNSTCVDVKPDLFVPISVVRAALITAGASCVLSLSSGFYVVWHPRSKCGVTILGSTALLCGLCCLLAASSWITKENIGTFGYSFYFCWAAMALSVVLGVFVVGAPWKLLLEVDVNREKLKGATLRENENIKENSKGDCHENKEGYKEETKTCQTQKKVQFKDVEEKDKRGSNAPYRKGNMVYRIARVISAKLRYPEYDIYSPDPSENEESKSTENNAQEKQQGENNQEEKQQGENNQEEKQQGEINQEEKQQGENNQEGKKQGENNQEGKPQGEEEKQQGTNSQEERKLEEKNIYPRLADLNLFSIDLES